MFLSYNKHVYPFILDIKRRIYSRFFLLLSMTRTRDLDYRHEVPPILVDVIISRFLFIESTVIKICTYNWKQFEVNNVTKKKKT